MEKEDDLLMLMTDLIAKKRDGGRKAHAAPTVWATENPVSVTEIPVTLTVRAESRPLSRYPDALF